MANPSYLALTSMFGQIIYSGMLPGTRTAIYTVGGSSSARLTHGTVCNTTGTTRSVTDASTTNGSTTVTSASANFTSADIGKTITGVGMPANATITAVASATSITISATATATGTNVALAWGWTAQVVTVSLALHKASDVPDGTHTVLAQLPVQAGDTISLRDYLDGAMLAAGESIWMHAGTANMVTAVLTGAVSS
jgi:hypothetical protein